MVMEPIMTFDIAPSHGDVDASNVWAHRTQISGGCTNRQRPSNELSVRTKTLVERSVSQCSVNNCIDSSHRRQTVQSKRPCSHRERDNGAVIRYRNVSCYLFAKSRRTQTHRASAE